MSELFDDEDDTDKEIDLEDEFVEPDDIVKEIRQKPLSDARRRLEDLLEERRLRSELEDYLEE